MFSKILIVLESELAKFTESVVVFRFFFPLLYWIKKDFQVANIKTTIATEHIHYSICTTLGMKIESEFRIITVCSESASMYAAILQVKKKIMFSWQ